MARPPVEVAGWTDRLLPLQTQPLLWENPHRNEDPTWSMYVYTLMRTRSMYVCIYFSHNSYVYSHIFSQFFCYYLLLSLNFISTVPTRDFVVKVSRVGSSSSSSSSMAAQIIIINSKRYILHTCVHAYIHTFRVNIYDVKIQQKNENNL